MAKITRGTIALGRWIKKHGSVADFAKRSGVTPGQLSWILSGGRGVGLDNAFRIERATGGEIDAEWFCGSRRNRWDK